MARYLFLLFLLCGNAYAQKVTHIPVTLMGLVGEDSFDCDGYFKQYEAIREEFLTFHNISFDIIRYDCTPHVGHRPIQWFDEGVNGLFAMPYNNAGEVWNYWLEVYKKEPKAIHIVMMEPRHDAKRKEWYSWGYATDWRDNCIRGNVRLIVIGITPTNPYGLARDKHGEVAGKHELGHATGASHTNHRECSIMDGNAMAELDGCGSLVWHPGSVRKIKRCMLRREKSRLMSP